MQPREFRLLEYLMRHAGQVVTRTMLLESVWEYHFDPQTNVIDVHIIAAAGQDRQGLSKRHLLHTVRGAGLHDPCALKRHTEARRCAPATCSRTQAFRIVLVYVVLFALSVTALLAFTYWNTRRTLDGQTDQIVEAELTGLAEQYQHFGLRGLAQSVRNRTTRGGQALYLLTDARSPSLGRQSGSLASRRWRLSGMWVM